MQYKNYPCRHTKTSEREKILHYLMHYSHQLAIKATTADPLLVCYCLHFKWYIDMLGLSIQYNGWAIDKNNKEVKGYTGEKFKITITNIYRWNLHILIYIFIYRRAIRRTNLSTYVPSQNGRRVFRFVRSIHGRWCNSVV